MKIIDINNAIKYFDIKFTALYELQIYTRVNSSMIFKNMNISAIYQHIMCHHKSNYYPI